MSLRINGELELPLSAAIQRFAFLAKTGAGKTYCAAVLAEEMLKNQVPIIVIDPMGVWWGLRKGADGKSDGYPVVIFGGEHADLTLPLERPDELARALVASNISAVIDVADLSHAALQRFIPPFLDELRRINREDRHIFIEEADVIAPQKPQKDETRCLGAVDVFVRRGGNKNLGVTLISQRSAVVNKNVLTQSDYLVVLRTTAPQDKAAVADWAVSKSADRKELNLWLDSLANLKNGEAYLWGEFSGEVDKIKVQFRARETFHATRENLKKFKGIEPMPIDLFVKKFRDKWAAPLPTLQEGMEGQTITVSDAESTRLLSELADAKEMADRQRQLIEEKNGIIDGLNVKVRRLQAFEDWLAAFRALAQEGDVVTFNGDRMHLKTLETAAEDQTVRANISKWIANANVPAHARALLQVFAESPVGVRFLRGQLAVSAKMSPTSSNVGKGISYLKRNGLVSEAKDGVHLVGE